MQGEEHIVLVKAGTVTLPMRYHSGTSSSSWPADPVAMLTLGLGMLISRVLSVSVSPKNLLAALSPSLELSRG